VLSSRRPEKLARSAGEGGFTLLESAVASAMALIFMSALMLMSSNVLGLLRTAKDNVSINQALQERVERMRIANWAQITDATYLASNLLATDTDSTSSLPGVIETLTVSAYPAKSPAVRARVIRQSKATTIVLSDATLKDERMVRVDVEFKWQGFPKKRQRIRATSALIAQGGITK
jgi:hypothetical protein